MEPDHTQRPPGILPGVRLGSPNVVNPPWAHQTEALEFIAEKPGAMLAMDMGPAKAGSSWT